MSDTTPSVGDLRVSELWQHPVKSLQGRSLASAEIDGDGLRGDRSWGIVDQATGKVLTGRREPRLLLASAELDDGTVVLHLPTGATCRGLGADTDAALSDWLGAAVALVRATDEPPGEAEFFLDPTDDSSEALAWTMPEGRFVDALPLLVLSTASTAMGRSLHPDGDWNPRRFRPNVLIDAGGESWLEDGWRGGTIRVGEVEIDVVEPCARCTMVTRPQPGLERDLDVYRTLARHHGGTLGMWSSVRTPGTIHVGDQVTRID